MPAPPSSTQRSRPEEDAGPSRGSWGSEAAPLVAFEDRLRSPANGDGLCWNSGDSGAAKPGKSAAHRHSAYQMVHDTSRLLSGRQRATRTCDSDAAELRKPGACPPRSVQSQASEWRRSTVNMRLNSVR